MASSPPEDVLALRRELDAARLEAASERARAGSFAAEIATLKARTVLAYSLGEEEEELRNNTLMKKLAEVNTEKREMLMRVDVEEEFLTNALQKRLDKVLLEKRELELRLTSMVSESTRTQKESLERERVALVKEKVRLELALETEQEAIVNKLTKQTSHLQSEKDCLTLEREQLRKQVASLLLDKNKLHAEKVTLENTLEQEEENIVNRLQTQMLELFTRNQILQRKLEHGVSQTNSVVSESEPELSEDEGGSMRSGRGGGSSRRCVVRVSQIWSRPVLPLTRLLLWRTDGR
jgi:coiled-coil domain-containing protein 6